MKKKYVVDLSDSQRELLKDCVEKGFSEALGRSARQEAPCQRKLDGAAEVRLIALSCGQPSECFRRWTLRLLASELVNLEIVESISPETLRRTLKNVLKPHLRQQWVIPRMTTQRLLCLWSMYWITTRNL